MTLNLRDASRKIAVGFGCMALSACVVAPHQAGRYLNIKSELTGQTIVQLDPRIEGLCPLLMQNFHLTLRGQPSLNRLQCSADYLGASLPVMAQLETDGHAFEADFQSMEICSEMLSKITQQGTKIFMPCRKK